MELKTSQLGTLTYEDKDIMYFPEGLYGFDHLKQFLLIPGSVGSVFSYLQSIEDSNITFILAPSPKDNKRLYLNDC